MGAAATKACALDIDGIAPPACCCACPREGSVNPRSKRRNLRRMVATPNKALTLPHFIRRSCPPGRFFQSSAAMPSPGPGLSRQPVLCYNRGAVKHTGQQEIAFAAARGVVVGESGPLTRPVRETSTHLQEDASRYCPVCSQRLESRRCKLVCNVCGYYMSCADYY